MNKKYLTILEFIQDRMKTINQISLEDDDYNIEFLELKKIEDSLFKILKLNQNKLKDKK